MRRHIIAVIAASAVVLTLVCLAATHATATLNESETELVGLNFFGPTDAPDELSAARRTAP
jgi:hypothetical protein